MRAEIPFVGAAYADEAKPLSAQECINLVPEITETKGARAVSSLKVPPGYAQKFTLDATGETSGIRGLLAVTQTGTVANPNPSRLYIVVGSKLAVCDASGLDEFATGASIQGYEMAEIAYNGTSLLIFAPGQFPKLYSYVISTNVLTDITTSVAFVPGSISFVNGYYIVTEKGGGRWARSNLNSLVFEGLNVATAESSTDNLLRAFEDHGDLWLLGAETIEIWANTGNGDLAFERNSGATIEHGLGALESVAKVDNGVFWLGDDGIVYAARGYAAQRISTYPIEQDIAEADFSNAVAFVWKDKGHTYYVLHLDGRTGRQQRKTWVYDLSTQLWHRRKSFGMENWNLLHYARFQGMDLGASNVLQDTIPVYQMLPSLKSEAGQPLIRERKTGYVFNNQAPVFMDSLELVMNTGNAPINEAYSVDLRYSDDAGNSWCAWKPRSLGLTGQYGKRIRFTQLGRFRNRLFHLRVTDPVESEFVSAVANMREGTQQ